MDKGKLMEKVQIEQLKQTEVSMKEWFQIKTAFVSKQIKVQQTIIKNTSSCIEITLFKLREIHRIFEEQLEVQHFTLENTQKVQEVHKRVLQTQKKTTQSQLKKAEDSSSGWDTNVDKVFMSFGEGTKKRIANVKDFITVIQRVQDEVSKEESKYESELKKQIKNMEKSQEKIEEFQKQQTKTVSNICKQSKNKQRDGCFYIGQYKKLEHQIVSELKMASERGKAVLALIRFCLQSEKRCCKTLKDQLTAFMKAKNLISKENAQDERILGVLAVLCDDVAQERKKYLNGCLLNEDQLEEISSVMSNPTQTNGAVPNLEAIVGYLKLSTEDFLKKVNLQNKFNGLLNNLSFKSWKTTSMAQGWLITSYEPVSIYMSLDNCMGIFSVETGSQLSKLNLNDTKINKIDDKNTIYLEHVTRGFFSNGKEELQIRFEKDDSLDEFVLFMENHIRQ